MKRFDRRVLGIFLAPVVFIAALASGSYSISAYAEEITEQFTISEEEQPLADKPRKVQPEEAKPGEVQPEEVAYEAPEGQEPSFVAPKDQEDEIETWDTGDGAENLTDLEPEAGADAEVDTAVEADAQDRIRIAIHQTPGLSLVHRLLPLSSVSLKAFTCKTTQQTKT